MKFDSLCCFLLCGILITACNDPLPVKPKPSVPTARIVSSLPHRGPLSHQARLMIQAIDLAVVEMRPRLPSVVLEHVSLDSSAGEGSEWTAERERQNANQAVDDPAVMAYMGPYNSGATAVSMPVTGKAGLLQIGPVATWPGITVTGYEPGEPGIYRLGGGRNYARLMPGDQNQAGAAAKWAAIMGLRNIFIVHDASTYSMGLGSAFATSAPEAGLAVIGMGSADDPALVEMLDSSGAKTIFYAPGSVNEAVRFAALLEAGPPRDVFLSDVAMDEKFAQKALPGAGAQRWHMIFNGVVNPVGTDRTSSFSTQFEKTYGEKPSQFAANAYDSTMLVLSSLADIGTPVTIDRTAILKKVLATRKWEGASGLISFDENGDRAEWQMSGYDLVDGRLTFMRLLSNGSSP